MPSEAPDFARQVREGRLFDDERTAQCWTLNEAGDKRVRSLYLTTSADNESKLQV